MCISVSKRDIIFKDWIKIGWVMIFFTLWQEPATKSLDLGVPNIYPQNKTAHIMKTNLKWRQTQKWGRPKYEYDAKNEDDSNSEDEPKNDPQSIFHLWEETQPASESLA